MKIIINTILIALMALILVGCGKKTEEKQNLPPKKTHHIVQNQKRKTVQIKHKALQSQPIVSQSISQVVLHGTVLDTTTDQPVSNFYFSATPRGLYKKAGSPGHFSGKIILDESGEFVISNLVEATYTLKIDSDDFYTFETNIYLCEKENYVDFSLVPLKQITIKGKVVYDENDEPAPNINVKFVSLGNTNDLSETTDINGGFSFQTLIKDHSIGSLEINEPGYAALKYNIYNNYPGEEIPLVLKEVSCINGVVKTPEGKPVSNVLVSVYYDYHYAPKFGNKNSFSKKLDESVYINAEYKADKPTTYSGEFIISNVAGIEVYCFKIDSEDYYLPWNERGKPKSIIVNKKLNDGIKLIVYPKSKVLLKVHDEKGAPILKYKLEIMTENEWFSDSYIRNVSLLSDNWYSVITKFNQHEMKLSLTATTDDEKVAVTNGVILSAGKTNFITMVLSSEKQISGFVYYPDDSPAIDAWVAALVEGSESYRNAYTDYLGYFEIAGLSAKSNDIIEVSVCVKNGDYEAETNVLFGSRDVEIYLSPLPKIFGRVSLDYSDNPATNFTVSIANWKAATFRNKEGKFSINMFSGSRLGTNFVYIISSGYAPRKVYFDFIKNKACNLGEIILSGKPATITGRVVNQIGNSVSGHVYLYPKDGNELNVRTDANGKYIFTDLPIEPVTLCAYTFYGKTESGVIHPLSDKITEVPDLVIYNTNAAEVEITFILPSGDYPAKALVQNIRKTTDKNGTIKILLRFGKHKNWKVLYKDKIYFAENFYVSPNTKKLKVKLTESSGMKVSFFLNGKLMKKDYIRYYYNGEDVYEDIPDGTLVINNLPGKYVFYSESHGVATTVDLYEGEENVVNFTTENAALEVELPYKGRWQVDAMLLINGAKAEVGSQFGKTDLSRKVFFKNIPAGEYELWVYCSTPSAKTNFIMRATAY